MDLRHVTADVTVVTCQTPSPLKRRHNHRLRQLLPTTGNLERCERPGEHQYSRRRAA